MTYKIDLEKLEMEIGMGDEGNIRARIVYWVPIDGQIKHELGNDEYCIYWSNQTAHYYAVPRKILYDQEGQ